MPACDRYVGGGDAPRTTPAWRSRSSRSNLQHRMIDNCIKSLELMEFNKCLFCLMILAFRVHLPKSIFLHASLIRWWRWPMLKFRIKETRCSSATWPSSTSSELTRPHVYTERQCYIKNQFTSAVWFVANSVISNLRFGNHKKCTTFFCLKEQKHKIQETYRCQDIGLNQVLSFAMLLH